MQVMCASVVNGMNRICYIHVEKSVLITKNSTRRTMEFYG